MTSIQSIVEESSKHWREWTSDDWNAALVNAVFRDPENAGRPIKRVTATGRFLAQVVSEGESDADSVKAAFLRSFGSAPHQIRSFFRWTVQKKRSLDTECPSFFAQLYLTLLAGSADEVTFKEGDFRKRFSLLMRHARVPEAFPFDDLARMWLSLAKWSQNRALVGDVCRPLNLPNPYNENRIGYSKRLAFPSFLDERRLGVLIPKLGDASDWKTVSQFVSKNIASFSYSFREEFHYFSDSIVNARLEEAFNSPFWGAIQDLTWDIELLAIKRNGSYILTVDLSDPNNPWIDLWGNPLAIEKLDDECETSHLPSDPQGYRNIIHRDGTRWNALELRGLVNRHTGVSSTPLGRDIKHRTLVFLSDEFGRLSTSGRFTDRGRVALMLERSHAQNIYQICNQLEIKVLLTEKAYESDSDALLYFSELSEVQLLQLAEKSNDALLRLICSRRGSTPITTSGGSWFGQLLLMNPASSPLFRMEEAETGEYEFLNNDVAQLCSGSLEKGDDGFRIPSCALANLENPCTLKLTLSSPKNKKEKTIFGRSVIKEAEPQKITNLNRWKVENTSLSLSELESELLLPAENFSSSPNKSELIRQLLSGIKFETSGSDQKILMQGGFSDIHQTIRWAWDALALRFQYTQTISFRELFEIADAAARPCHLNPYFVVRVLMAAGWIVRISVASFRADSYACGTREMVVHVDGERAICHLLGPLSTSYWNELKLYLNQIGVEPLVLLEQSEPYSLGVTLVTFESMSGARDFSTKFNLPMRTGGQIEQPLLAPEKIDLKLYDQPTLIKKCGARFEKFVRQKGWTDVDNHQRLSTGDMLRPTDKRHLDYLIFYKDQYVATDSAFLARLLYLTLSNQKIGIVNDKLDITFNNFLTNVPRLLSRWCMSHGAGCVTIKMDGSISYSGKSARVNSRWLDAWISATYQNVSDDVRLSRRNLALSIRRSKRTRIQNS